LFRAASACGLLFILLRSGFRVVKIVVRLTISVFEIFKQNIRLHLQADELAN
jgi:hypothetical protein